MTWEKKKKIIVSCKGKNKTQTEYLKFKEYRTVFWLKQQAYVKKSAMEITDKNV